MSAVTYVTAAQLDASPRSLFTYDEQAFGNSGVILATKTCTVINALGINKSASLLWLMLFDATSVPGNGTVPLIAPLALVQNVVTQARFDVRPRIGGIPTTTGLCWAASTTPGTLTVDATASVWATIQYV